eukprot:Nitzschia sp. Nitz4//scaffold44_size153857//140987//143257//NITZ4_002749-RA/size153857-processed-gene-0.138-mRNA-1//1//CDS//3329552241//7388//frame0
MLAQIIIIRSEHSDEAIMKSEEKYRHKHKNSRPLSSTPTAESPFRVLGVALVVDRLGTGAKLVARYPAQPPEAPKVASARPEEATSNRDSSKKSTSKASKRDSSDGSDSDLFFTLPARQMAKLFRTKRSLCGIPMTLAVSGTVFCCRAVLLQGDDTVSTATSDDSVSTANGGSPIVLFSVIVALAATDCYSSVHFSSWLDSATTTEDQLEIQRYIREATAAASTLAHPTDSASKHKPKVRSGTISSEFLAIRRVHISLSRYCRALEREERRCRYISLQADQFFVIQADRQKIWDEQRACMASAINPSSSASVVSSKLANPGERRSRHARSNSYGTAVTAEDLSAPVAAPVPMEPHQENDQDHEQELLELMLAAQPPAPPAGIPPHHGNLVRELVQVFHSISRNDHTYPQTPLALLIERDGVVYVNQHIAIPMEAASSKALHTVDRHTIRPYNTLLFPHASPSNLLQAFQASGSTPPQRLQKLLLTVNAQKPLTDIAIDANLPLSTTLELASYLVQHGACVMSPVVSRQSRLACHQMERIWELGLEFSQLFPKIPLMRLVGYLTSVKTLGEAMLTLTLLDSEEGFWLRELLDPSLDPVVNGGDDPTGGRVTPMKPSQPQDAPVRWEEELEQRLYAMAVWLLSHRILTQVQDYCVVDGVDSAENGPNDDKEGISKPASYEADESLFRELLSLDMLNGEISIMALSWRLGLDAQKVRAWGLRHRLVRVVSRIPKPGDDWDPSWSGEGMKPPSTPGAHKY